MKTILHLSIILMLAGGSAGAIDFIKMYRSGEIDKIYDRNEKPTIAHIAPTPTALSPIEIIKPVIRAIKKNISEVSIQPKLYSRAPLRNNNVEAIPPTPEVTDTIETSNTQPQIAEVEKSIIPAPATASTGQKEEPEKKKPTSKKKFKLSMYSRAMIRTEDVVEELDSVSASSSDTTVIQTTAAK